jgi:hypothetical protein
MILCYFFNGGHLPWMNAEITDMDDQFEFDNQVPIPGMG